MNRATNSAQLVVLTPPVRAKLEQMAEEGPGSLTRRVRIILARADGVALGSIAEKLRVHRDSVRRWIKRFNRHGLDGLQHGNTGKSRNVVFDATVCGTICQRASSSPPTLGEPYATWSLYKLRDHLIRRRVVRTISVERLRQLLNAGSYTRDYWPDGRQRRAPQSATSIGFPHHSAEPGWTDRFARPTAPSEPGVVTPVLRRSVGR